jgi:hypothetical protein
MWPAYERLISGYDTASFVGAGPERSRTPWGAEPQRPSTGITTQFLARIIHKFRQEKATDSPKLCY